MKKKKDAKREPASARQANMDRRKKRRHGRYILHYILIAAFVLSVGAALSLTVFFKIEKVEVAGNTKYPPQEIIAASGIQPGQNLFRVHGDQVSEKLTQQFAYIESVKVEYRLPPRVVLKITQATPLGALESGEGEYILISREGKVLEKNTGEPEGRYPLVKGVDVGEAQVGSTLGAEAKERLRMLTYLVDALESTGFPDVTEVDLTDRLNMQIVYQDRLLIQLGSEGDLEYKLQFVTYALENSVEDGFEGVLDASIPKELHILPKEIRAEEASSQEALSPQDGVGQTPPEGDSSSQETSSSQGEGVQ